MDELEYAEQGLVEAEALRTARGHREVPNRMIASTLYYGAHHLSRLLLQRLGEDPASWMGEIHRRVIDELEARLVVPGDLSRRALRHLRWMRAKRVKADYELRRAFQPNEMDRLFEVYREFLAEVQALLPAL